MKTTSRLLAADERGLPITVLVAGVLVVSFDYALHALVAPSAWTHDFFFKRGFVQWVLLSAFAIGLVHLIRRLPPLLREKRALRQLHKDASELTSNTLVERRWRQIRTAGEEHGRKNLEHYAKSLAEHDEAEVDAAYRISGDVVQILPLMGFFGTVFGLSHGLYNSFLATGGTNTKDFAKAIAIAFDNTLLGLALTIILFVIQSVLRKREEATLLQLNLSANDAIAETVERPATDPLHTTIVGLNTMLKLLERPFEEIKSLVEVHTNAVAKSVFIEMSQLQKADQDRIAQLVSSLAQRDSTLIDRLLALEQIRLAVEGVAAETRSTAQAVAGFGTRLDAVPEERRTVEGLAASIKELAHALAQRDSLMLNTLQSSLATHSQDLKAEIRQPRTIRFVESPHLRDGDGNIHQQ